MRWFYSGLLYLSLPFVVLRLFLRGLRAPAYRDRWRERFGYPPAMKQQPRIWLHAVSVGEFRAAIPLIEAALCRWPDYRVLVTTTTPTGAAQVRQVFGQRVDHCYLPYDLPGAVSRFLACAQPRVALVMEKELWPNLFDACSRERIPLYLLNARISTASAARYRFAGHLLRKTLSCIEMLFAQTTADARRFVELGIKPGRVVDNGNLKFDVQVDQQSRDQASAWRADHWGVRPVFLAASTHEREEPAVLAAFAQLRREIGDLLLLWVPRHPERFDAVVRQCEDEGYRVARASGPEEAGQADVFVGDVMGELMFFYCAADLAFVGGSLSEDGGHNMIEPAAAGTPQLFGPHTTNFAELAEALIHEGAARRVANADALATTVLAWLRDESSRLTAGQCGRALVSRNRGATERVLEHLAQLVG